MPLDHLIISKLRNPKWINVIMLDADDGNNEATQSTIDVSPYGIRWIEQGSEQRVLLSNYFMVEPMLENAVVMYEAAKNDDSTCFALGLTHVNNEILDQDTVNVAIKELQPHFDPATPCTIYCSHCANEVVSMHRFESVAPVPVCTMQPASYFRPVGQKPNVISNKKLFYGLNHIVIDPRIFGPRVQHIGKHIHCGCCLQQLGDSVVDGQIVQLFADTLRLERVDGNDAMPGHFVELFAPITSVQVILRLLHDAVPINAEKTRLFLKTVRPDGQLHYLLLMIDTHQVHLLRSKQALAADLRGKERAGGGIVVQDVELRGHKGCRINFQVFCTDEELSANDRLIELWRNTGIPILRISYNMMMDLVNDLILNEQMVKMLEKLSPEQTEGRTSYIIFETDAEIQAKQQGHPEEPMPTGNSP